MNKSPKQSNVNSKKTRVSVSFPSELYETLEKLSKDKKVSMAWVVRDAAEKYVCEQWPLLSQHKND